MIKAALAGNPNSGKTTLFNALTGSNQRVGNWPGVTVEQKTGKMCYQNKTVELIDLPGIYSLAPYSSEEKVSRNYILNEKPDVIINIIDATNLERNLYLTTQIIDLEVPTVIALNMIDEINNNGDSIDIKLLSQKLDMPVFPISAKHRTGIDALVKGVIELAEANKPSKIKFFKPDIESTIEQIIKLFPDDTDKKRWRSIKLIENDELAASDTAITDQIKHKAMEKINSATSVKESLESIVAQQRYLFISSIIKDCLKLKNSIDTLTLSDKIDKILTHKIFALPIFALIMYLLFQMSFGLVSSFLADAFEGIFGTLGEKAGEALASVGASDFVIGLTVDGVIGGLGGIAPFIPPIFLMFIFMTILEDSGYMARAAFIMDKIFRKFGLSGKSFIPMLVGFGCTAPAVMSARTLENEGDRKLTIMLTPFMSCGARLPIYALFASAFFQGYEGIVVFSMYFLGVLVAILSGIVLKKTLFKGETSPFIMELPPYRLPSFRDMLLHVWEKVRGFVIRAGTVIVAISVFIWVSSTYSFSLQPVEDSADSILAVIGGVLAPIFAPLGFGNWEATSAILTGIAAKEAVVSTMSVLFGVDDAGLAAALSTIFTSASALSFMVFCLLYIPCGAAFMTVRKEMGTWKWTGISAAYQMCVAWVLSFLVYNISNIMM